MSSGGRDNGGLMDRREGDMLLQLLFAYVCVVWDHLRCMLDGNGVGGHCSRVGCGDTVGLDKDTDLCG